MFRSVKQLQIIQMLTAAGCAMLGMASVVGCGNGALSAPKRTARPATIVEREKGRGVDEPVERAQPKAGQSGAFSGRITTDAKSSAGKPPGYVAKQYCMNPAVAKKIIDDSLIVSRNGGLANAYVYLPRAPVGYEPPPIKREIEFTNRDCMFNPRALSVRVGQTIRVTNQDNVAHNTHANPVAGGIPSQNVPFGDVQRIKYEVAEPIPVKVNCDIHGWMFAYQLPLDHDLVAITDKDGKFTINNLPAGTHTFRVWHEKAGYLERNLTVVIRPGKTTKKTRKYKAAKFAGLFGHSPNLVTLSTK